MEAREKFMSWVDQFIKAYAGTVANSDESGWYPFDPYLFYPYFSDLFIKKLIIAQKKATAKGVSLEELAKTFAGPLTIRVELHFLFLDIKNFSYFKTREGENLLNFFDSLLKEKCTADIYGIYSAQVQTTDKINEFVKNFPWQKPDFQHAREIGKLISACSHLSWALYTDYCYMQWYEILGPYKLAGDRILLIRQYSNFRPKKIWPQFKDFSFKDVLIYTIYKNASIKLDQWSHLKSQDNLVAKMEKAAVEVNGRSIKNIKKITKIRQTIEKAAQAQFVNFGKEDFESIKKKVIELRYYIYKDFFTKLGMHWQPEKEVFERVKNKRLMPRKYPRFKNINHAKEFWSQFIDPRIE